MLLLDQISATGEYIWLAMYRMISCPGKKLPWSGFKLAGCFTESCKLSLFFKLNLSIFFKWGKSGVTSLQVQGLKYSCLLHNFIHSENLFVASPDLFFSPDERIVIRLGIYHITNKKNYRIIYLRI